LHDIDAATNAVLKSYREMLARARKQRLNSLFPAGTSNFYKVACCDWSSHCVLAVIDLAQALRQTR